MAKLVNLIAESLYSLTKISPLPPRPHHPLVITILLCISLNLSVLDSPHKWYCRLFVFLKTPISLPLCKLHHLTITEAAQQWCYKILTSFFKKSFIFFFFEGGCAGSSCCMWAFAICSKWGLLFVAALRLLTAVVSLVLEQALVCGLSSCSPWA